MTSKSKKTARMPGQLAGRLQGKHVRRSGVFGVVRERLAWPAIEEKRPLPGELHTSLI